MKNKFLLLIVAVLLAVSPVLAVNGPATSGDGSATSNKATTYCGVYGDQIVQYMFDRGYMVVEMEQIAGMCDVLVNTSDAKRFIIHISNSQIIGHEDIL